MSGLPYNDEATRADAESHLRILRQISKEGYVDMLEALVVLFVSPDDILKLVDKELAA